MGVVLVMLVLLGGLALIVWEVRYFRECEREAKRLAEENKPFDLFGPDMKEFWAGWRADIDHDLEMEEKWDRVYAKHGIPLPKRNERVKEDR